MNRQFFNDPHIVYVDFFVYSYIMGLLSTTYVKNTTVRDYGSEGVVHAMKEQTAATSRVAKSTQNVADAINKGRVNITHDRYAELTNKTRLLGSIYEFMNSYITIIFRITQQDTYIKFMNNMLNIRGCSQYHKGYVGINDKLHLGVNEEERTCNIYVDNNLFTVTIPDYIPNTEGHTNINEGEYKTLLNNELLLESYSKAVDDLSHLCFRLLNFKNTQELINDSIDCWFRYLKEFKNNQHYHPGMTMHINPIKTNKYTWRLNTKVADQFFGLKLHT